MRAAWMALPEIPETLFAFVMLETLFTFVMLETLFAFVMLETLFAFVMLETLFAFVMLETLYAFVMLETLFAFVMLETLFAFVMLETLIIMDYDKKLFIVILMYLYVRFFWKRGLKRLRDNDSEMTGHKYTLELLQGNPKQCTELLRQNKRLRRVLKVRLVH
ncbi:unnamed protein product [Cuscuta campestris]|uniref:Uncharacterized protein n=1 Tax=Cuscuta campestris TaxID=132261 RepID=A0A484KCQ1_9ASTE|nr:unnamed protein product [Cuscuta campestris]